MEVVSFLESVERGMDDNLFNFTKGGKCSSCGKCCSNLLPMSKKEIQIIHEYIRNHNILESKHILPVAKQHYDMVCPFRDNGKKICTIYPVRPEICRQFICDSEKRAKRNRALIRQTMETILVREEFFGGKT